MSSFKYFRTQKGLSQKEVGDYLGITGQAYSNYETGKRQADYETLLKLSELFSASIEEMLSDDAEQTKKLLINGDEELTEYLEMLKNRPEMKMLFSLTKGATKEDVERAVRIIEAALGE